MALHQMWFFGDSLTEGSTNAATLGLGGTGTYFQLLQSSLGAIPGLGPIASSGFIYCGSNVAGGTSKWSFTGGGNAWTSTTGSDAWDISPYGSSGGNGTLRYGNGINRTATFTASADITYPNVGFTLYAVDYTSGGNWSYRINSGTWTASGITTTANNVVKFHVATPLSLSDTVTIRCANAANSDVGCAPLGIEVFYQTPSTASGLILHQAAVFGAALRNMMGAGDRLALLKRTKVTLGSGAISHLPDLGTFVMHINDTAGPSNGGWTDVDTWASDLTGFHAIAALNGPVGIISPFEVATASYPQVDQTAFRARTHTTGAAVLPSAKVLDLYERFRAKGLGTYTQMNGIGYLGADSIHETSAGHAAIAPYVHEWLMQNYLRTYAVSPAALSVNGKRTDVAYRGAMGTLAYGAYRTTPS